MHLQSTCELQVYVHGNNTFLVITRIKPRNVRYFNGQDRKPTHHWLCLEHWAEYEAGLQKIFDKYDGKEFANEEFQINPLIRVQINNASFLKKSMCSLLNLIDGDKDNVALIVECRIEYVDETEKNAKGQETREEYKPKGNSTVSHVPYVPAKKQMLLSPKLEETEPYEVIGSSPEKIYTPLPIKRRKEKTSNVDIRKAFHSQRRTLGIGKEKSKPREQCTTKSKKVDDDERDQGDMLAKYVTKDDDDSEIETPPNKRKLKCIPNSGSDIQLRRSARSPVKPKYLMDSIDPLIITTKNTHKRNNSDQKQDNNNNASKQKLEWGGKMKASDGKKDRNKKCIQPDLVSKAILYPDEEKKDNETSMKEGDQNEQYSNDNYTEYTNEELEEQEAKFTKELKENEEIGIFLDKNLEPPPREVNFLPLDQLSKEEVLESFSEHRIKLDGLLKELRAKSKVFHSYGINHYTIMGLISDEIQNEMMTKLGDVYDSQLTFLSRIKTYTNALLPEWIVRIFMKKYNFSYRQAIDQIIAQKKYRQYKEAELESNDLSVFA